MAQSGRQSLGELVGSLSATDTHQGAGFSLPASSQAGWMPSPAGQGHQLPPLPPLLGLQGAAQPPDSGFTQCGHLLLCDQLSSLPGAAAKPG